MASDHKEKKEKKDKKDKKDKKEKKEKKRSEVDGVHKEKKDRKKERKEKEKLAKAVGRALEAPTSPEPVAAGAGQDRERDQQRQQRLAELDAAPKKLVPFAFPFANPELQQRLLNAAQEASKVRSLHRGVKDVVKVLKRLPKRSTGALDSSPVALVIMAANIFPAEVIMHFPMLCEEKGVSYMFVSDRRYLGEVAHTKRSTSIVLLAEEPRKPANPAAGDKMNVDGGAGSKAQKPVDAKQLEEYKTEWRAVIKIANQAWRDQVEPWARGMHPAQMAGHTIGGR